MDEKNKITALKKRNKNYLSLVVVVSQSHGYLSKLAILVPVRIFV
jgi:hypothetical protein